MEIIKSTYREDVVFAGFDGDADSSQIISAIEQQLDLESGRDFDDISREDMEAPHTNTDDDLESFESLHNNYEHVEFVTLRPVR